jgi:hypothetical protein
VVDDLRSRGLDRQNEVKFLCLRDYMAAQAILTKELVHNLGGSLKKPKKS